MATALSKNDRSRIKVQGHPLPSKSQILSDADNVSDSATSGYATNVPSSDEQPSNESSEVNSESGEHADVMDQVMAMNKNLVQQIDALRLRLEIDFKHNQEQRAIGVAGADAKLHAREAELSNLKVKVTERTSKLAKLTDDNDKKSEEVEDLMRQIEDLRKAVGDTSIYADELESEMSVLKRDKGKLQTGAAYQEKEEEIRGLQREIGILRKNLFRMEKELTRAKQLIAQNGSKLRLMENENKNMLLKFREELNKISLNMRFEVGKMRDLMRSQWQEMRDLRQQNETMSNDIREIRELLLEQNKTKRRDFVTSKSSPGQFPYKEPSHMISMAFKPTFPVKCKDRENAPTQRK